MVNTGVLEKNTTEEQIMAAKKTVKVVTEIDGHKYVESFDGTKGLAVFVDNGKGIEGAIKANGLALANFASTLLEKLPVELCLMILSRTLKRRKI